MRTDFFYQVKKWGEPPPPPLPPGSDATESSVASNLSTNCVTSEDPEHAWVEIVIFFVNFKSTLDQHAPTNKCIILFTHINIDMYMYKQSSHTTTLN